MEDIGEAADRFTVAVGDEGDMDLIENNPS
jgi:hypothetical protein